MRTLLFATILVAAIAAAASAETQERSTLRVVATVPDLGDIVRRIGGERVSVTVIARGDENVHRVAMRPSHLVAMGRADLFVQMGLGLEHAFAPGLLDAARNPALRPGRPGFLDVSEGWVPIERPVEVTRRDAADVHPLGNPHWNLDPAAGRHIADRVLARLLELDPDAGELYRTNHAAFSQEVDRARERWDAMSAAWKGAPIVTYHREFSYLAAARGLRVVGEVEARPGVPPTPGHLTSLVDTMRRERVQVILTARWSNDRSVRFVAERSGARVVEVPTFVGGDPRVTTWIALLDTIHARLAEVLRSDGDDG